jgi:hypothetical protein
MNTTKNMILNKIDEMKDVDYYAEMNVLNAMVDTYCKAAMILENCDESTDVSSFRLFQEGYYMEDGEEGDTITKTDDGGYKINNSDQTYYTDKGFRRMKEDGSGLESIVWSIIAAIPRMIIAAVKSMFGNKTSPEQEKKKTEECVKTANAVQQSGNASQISDGINRLTDIFGAHPGVVISGAIASAGGLGGIVAAVANGFSKKAKEESEAGTIFEKFANIVKSDTAMHSVVNINTSETKNAYKIKVDFEKKEIITLLNIAGITKYFVAMNTVFDRISQYLNDQSFMNTDKSKEKTFNSANGTYNSNAIQDFYKEANVKPFNLFARNEQEAFRYSFDTILQEIDSVINQGNDLAQKMKKVEEDIKKLEQLSKDKSKNNQELGENRALRQGNAKRINQLTKEFAKSLAAHIQMVPELNIAIAKQKTVIATIVDTIHKTANEVAQLSRDNEIKNNKDRLTREIRESIENDYRASLTNDGFTEEELNDIGNNVVSVVEGLINDTKLLTEIGHGMVEQGAGTSDVSVNNTGSQTTFNYDGTNVGSNTPSSDTTDWTKPNPDIPVDLPDEQIEQDSYVEKNTGWSFSFNG